MDEPSRGSETEEGVLQPSLPESTTDPAGGSGFNGGLFALMLAIVLLVCVQNIWLRRRAAREQSATKEEGPIS